MRIHTTRRLKDRILSQIPALEKHKQRREVFLAFKKDLANALQKTHKEDRDEEAMHCAKAASISAKSSLLNTHLTDLLTRTARRIPFHHHWYLSSTFFMVLTLKCKQAL